MLIAEEYVRTTCVCLLIPAGFDEVLVAVIDSGIELSHGGVGAAVWANAGEVAGDGLDNDNNGKSYCIVMCARAAYTCS